MAKSLGRLAGHTFLLVALLLVARSAESGPAESGHQQRQVISRLELVCAHDDSIPCPTDRDDAEYCIKGFQDDLIFHPVCNPNLDCEGSEGLDSACVPVIVDALPAALHLSAQETPGEGCGAPELGSTCVKLKLDARLDVQAAASLFSQDPKSEFEQDFWRDNDDVCNDDDSSGLRVSDWFPFPAPKCVFDFGINFDGLLIPGNDPSLPPAGSDQLAPLEQELVEFAGAECGFPSGSVLPVTMLADADPPFVTGDALVLDPDELRDGRTVAGTRSGWYALDVRYALAAQQHLPFSASSTCPGCFFGGAVDTSDDVAIVGAQGSTSPGGSASVLRFDGSRWIEEATWFPPPPGFTPGFGCGVAVSGERAITVAPNLAFPREFDGATWIAKSALVPPQLGSFGCSVAMDSVVAVLSGVNNRVYVYRDGVNGWALEQTLVPSDGQPGDAFGSSVSVSGDTILIGANGDDGRGSAYVFTRVGSIWQQGPKLFAADGEMQDNFGLSVDLSDDVGLVGAPYADGFHGAAYAFRFNGVSWEEIQELAGADGFYFGSSVSLADGVAIVGQRGADQFKGSAYMFRFDGSSWGFERELNASDRHLNGEAFFGWAVATDGVSAIVGAPVVNPGAAYAFRLAAPGGCGTVETDCENTLDDDGDGRTDGDDPGCSDSSDLSERFSGYACDDDIDNDGDGMKDFPIDPGCAAPKSSSEAPQCQDGLDNDGDGGIDFDGGQSVGRPPPWVSDTTCSSFTVGETPPRPNWTCGLGIELVPALTLLLLGHRRRRL